MTSIPVIQNAIERMKRKDDCQECDGKGIVSGAKYGSNTPIVCCDGCDGYGFIRSKKTEEVA